MRVHNVIYRDEANAEIECIGTFVNPAKAKVCLDEKVDSIKKEIEEGGGTVCDVKYYGDNEVAIEYDEAYVDLIRIVENEVE